MPDGAIQAGGDHVGSEWRADLLRRFAWLLCLFGTPLVLYLVALSPPIFGAKLDPVEIGVLCLVPVVAAAVAATPGKHLRARGTALILSLLLLGGVGSRYWGPTPGAFFSLMLAAVLATLLIGGRAGALALVLGAASLLAFGSAGRFETAPGWASDLLLPRTWIRMTFTYTLLTGALQLLVSGALRRVENSLHETRTALAEAVRERQARTEAELASRESEERLRQALDAAEMGTWEWDVPSGRIVWTGCAEALLGVPPGTPATIEAFRGTIHPADRSEVERAIDAALTGPGNDFKEEHRTNGDPPRWLQGRGRVYRDKADRPLRMRGTVQDITAQKHAEQSVRESEAELRALVSAMTDAIFVLDRDGRYLRVAPSAPTLLYRPASELVGRHLHDIFPAEDADAYLARIRQCLDTQQTVHFEYGMTIDGTRRWFAAAASPLLQDSVVWVARDVSDRKRAEEQLRASEERWRRISEATFEGIAFSENGVMIDTNPQLAEILGYAHEELVGKPVLECVAPEDRETVAAAIHGGRTSGYEHRALRKDGSTVVVETRARALSYGTRQLRVTAVRDVSERSRLEGELRRRERLAAIGVLVGGVAHEVRTPLFSISATLDALEVRSGRPQDDHELKDLLRSQVKRLSNLMQDLLDYSRQPRLRLERAAVADAVRLAVRHCPPRAAQRPGRISPALPESLPELSFDLGRIEQVLENLIANAVQHAPRGTAVAVSGASCELPCPGVTVCVEDEGSGILPDDLERVFEPFFSRRKGGTGLGLAIAQSLVEAHGGSISARNLPGRGAAFTVFLPRTPPSAESLDA
jgi:PAS domain S-box-containing protein